jgi:hypothetical protein
MAAPFATVPAVSGSARSGLRRQRGGAIVEFALIAVVFLMLLLGIMDFGRMLLMWNSTAEATRWGARIAVVCDQLTPDQVRGKMKQILPQLADANIVIEWQDPQGVASASCTKATCKGVEVRIYNNPANADDPSNLQFQAVSPYMGFVVPPVPAFATYLPRESMEATNASGDSNPVCL